MLDGNSGETGNRSLRSIHPVRRTVIIPAWSSNKLELTQWKRKIRFAPSNRFSLPLFLSLSLLLFLSGARKLVQRQRSPQVRMLYKSHQGISIHSGNRHIKRPAWRILSHNWFVPRSPFFYINREIEQCPRLKEQWENSLSAISLLFSLSLLFSSLILSSSSFPSVRGFSSFSFSSSFLSFFFTRSF